ncbi:hypothetical protein JYA60_14710 [Sphingomonas yabuuchiae]|nr:hypothetical protein [Sphingomonas yabuuchiae]
MLRGLKPLAMFVSEYERTPECLTRYFRMFDRHVESGRFVKREHAVAAETYRFSYVLYALPAEAWRIDRMIRLKELPGQWGSDREREEGHLLGYEDWMNDVWADLRMRKT